MAQKSLLSFFPATATPSKKRKIDEVDSTENKDDSKKEVQPTLENQSKRLKPDETPKKENPEKKEVEPPKSEEEKPKTVANTTPSVGSSSNPPRTPIPNEKSTVQNALVLGQGRTTISDSLKNQFSVLKYFTEPSWVQALGAEFNKPYFKTLMEFVDTERAAGTVYPPEEQVFTAFNACPFKNVKVVILGQDPYFNPKQAHGVSFSVTKGVKPPPSLVNIFQELKNDIGPQFNTPNHGYLMRWLQQGVLLLNAVLTVRANQANSHQKHGWEGFTDAAVKALNNNHKGLIFILWGRPAQDKGKIIDTKKHHVLKAAHPSPLSADKGFFGCRHFSKTNDLLKSMGKPIIDWNLDEPVNKPVVGPSAPAVTSSGVNPAPLSAASSSAPVTTEKSS